ncbi:MAG TPA: hypothetical protein VGQ75_08075 [Thermoanaerobaculia bacterium]|nr:hypothetical protein [Thermoanaerobaculia bacterium]
MSRLAAGFLLGVVSLPAMALIAALLSSCGRRWDLTRGNRVAAPVSG